MKLLAVPIVAVIVAAGEGDGLPPWAQVLIGIAALIAVLFKQLVPGWLYNDMKHERDQLRADNAHLVQTLLDVQPKTLSALEAGTSAVNEAMAEIRVMRRNP